MLDREKVIKGVDICVNGGGCKDGIPNPLCPYSSEVGCDLNQILLDAFVILKEQEEIINELIELGYPHNFQHEAPWVVEYLYDLTEIVKKAFKAKEGR